MVLGEFMPDPVGEAQQTQRIVLAHAVGTIEPGPRIKRGEITEIGVDMLVEGLKGEEFDVPLEEQAPSAAGGTFSLVMADALTTDHYRTGSGNLKDHAVTIYRFLSNIKDPQSRLVIPKFCMDGRPIRESGRDNTSVIGGHDADGVTNEDDCGCGAMDKAKPICIYIAGFGDELRAEVESRGVAVDDMTHRLILGKAGEMVASDYIPSGKELRGALVEVGGKASVVTVSGPHLEAAKRINMQPGVTLSHPKLEARFGQDYQAFEIDVPPLQSACEVISLSGHEAYQKFIAALYFNIAAGAVLAGPTLRDVTR